MIRSNLYEVAFEAYLRERKIGYVAVDEARRSLFNDGSVKSVDFIVVGRQSARLVVDVKGRKFPGGPTGKPKKTWQNWAETEDIAGLMHWSAQLGEGFRGILAFVYRIQPGYALAEGTPDVFSYKNQTYLMRALDVQQYQLYMRPRSPRWNTVHIPVGKFRELVRPFSDYLVG